MGKQRDQGSCFQPLGWMIIRCPALPATMGFLPNTMDDRATCRLASALEIATPSLAAELRKTDAQNPSALRKLDRYARRMGTRSTPYGMFSGVGIAEWRGETSISLIDPPVTPYARASMELLHQIRVNCEASPDILRAVDVFRNPLIEIIGRQASVWAGAGHESAQYSTALVPILDDILEASWCPAPTYKIFGSLLVDYPSLTEDQFYTMIGTLLDKSFLLSNLHCPHTSSDPLDYLIDRLSRIEAASNVVEQLCEIRSKITKINSEKELHEDDLIEVRRQCREIAPTLDGDPIIVDGVLNSSAAIVSNRVAADVVRLADVVDRLSVPRQRPKWYNSIKAQFFECYGYHRDVDLRTVLRHAPPIEFERLEPRATPRDILLLKIASRCLHARDRELHLNDVLITELQQDSSSKSKIASMDLAVSLCARSGDHVDRGDYKLLLSPLAGVGQAGRMAARFSGAFGDSLASKIAEICRLEDAQMPPEIITADLMYAPRRCRAHNLIMQPNARQYVITLNSSRNYEGATNIAIDELDVGVRDEELAIIWKRTRQTVRFSPLHMLTDFEVPSVLRFLSEVGGWRSGALRGFDWGLADTFPYLPRVVLDNLILQPRQWRIEGTTRIDVEWIEQWRSEYAVPQYLYLSEEDHRLLIDLNNRSHVQDVLAQHKALRGESGLSLQECLPDEADAWAESPSGCHFVELSVPLIRTSSSSPVPAPNLPQKEFKFGDRYKSLCSDWVYLRLYAPWSMQDTLIGEYLPRLAGGLPEGSEDRFFFIRYFDDRPHVRLRFWQVQGSRDDELVDRLAAWADSLMEQGVCTDYCFGVYDRELERYGGLEGMTLAESIFLADSRCSAELITIRLEMQTVLDAWELCVLSLDRLLESLGLDEEQRARWFYEADDAKPRFGAEFRKRKLRLRAILGAEADSVPAQIKEPLERRKRQILQNWPSILDLFSQGRLSVDPDRLRSCFAHLLVNRMVGVDQQVEDGIFSLLSRTRKSLLHHADV